MEKNNEKLFSFIESCTDADRLESLMINAQKRGELELYDAAFRKLISLVPSQRLGTVEYDFWQTIHAFEYLLKQERGKTTKLARVGEIQTLTDWALDCKETDGFKMLLKRDMPELTGEAIVLRHPGSFEAKVVEAAHNKLLRRDVDVNAIRLRQ